MKLCTQKVSDSRVENQDAFHAIWNFFIIYSYVSLVSRPHINGHKNITYADRVPFLSVRSNFVDFCPCLIILSISVVKKRL